ncbi:glycine rich domain-containing protein [Cohnella fermenti]|uniref:receptor protein-tyrosine kinase n=1 Tax=Cohnella fermenti TaxID=2565925 RepID=A0A4S4BHB5_9BACL|nr:glycine rich domain-containing protein [Cohnella fermenti]THF73936.1 hypothetical protein E6C55_27080 [Cohnella fermenti]
MKRILAVLMIAVILISSYPVQEIETVEAAVAGTTGSIPAGGTPNNGGMTGYAYRVGIVHEKLKNGMEFLEGESNAQLISKIQTQYNNHYPTMENSIVFAPSQYYDSNALLGWYASSSGEIKYVDDTKKAYKLRGLSSSYRSANLYYSSLADKAPYSKTASMVKLLGGGKWKGSVSADPTEAKKVWNYLLLDYQGIDSRIKNYIADEKNDSSNPEYKWEAILKYIDLLMTLYALSDSEQQKVYDTQIERIIASATSGVNTEPVLLVIDTVTKFTAPGLLPSGKQIFIPSTAYVDYAHSAVPAWSITNAAFNNGAAVTGGTLGLIELGAKKSIATLSTRKRLTDLTGQARKNNGLAWAYGGVVGKILYTTSGGTASWTSTSADSPVMKLLTFDADTYGFLVVGAGANKSHVDDCACTAKLSIAEKGGTVTTDTIGRNVPITVNMKASNAEYLKWARYIGTAPTVKVKIAISRTGGSGAVSITPQGNEPAINTTVSVASATVLDWLDPSSTTNPTYTDNISTMQIAAGSSVKLEYTLQAYITVGTDDPKECGGNSLPLGFNRPNNDQDLKGHYTSTPSYWSEIKEGSPGNEQFEAMAGTPTTRPLYFASGGSEFIVDIETEYVPDATSTRTYRSYFTSVPSEFKLGDQAGDYTVPTPSGASSSSLTVNAHTGGTVSATWTGTTPYTGNLSWSDHSSSGADSWNDAPYNNAMAQAQAWASAVNATVIKFTSASDKITRSFNAWGASASGSNSHPAGSVSIGHNAVPEVPCSGDPCTGGSPAIPYQATTGKQGTDGTYTITVTGTLPARIIDGPSSIYDLPMVQDTWSQTVNYDYMRINKVHVWKLDKSKVNGMTELIGTDEVTATVKQGDPSIFANIATANTSLAGRLRYSLEANQHDAVVWNEGSRSDKDDGNGDNGWVKGPGQGASWATGNTYTNSNYGTAVDYHVANSTAEDKATVEWKKFDERRRSLTTVTAVSDFLILQTSSGDQSVIYFDHTSPADQAQKPLAVPKTSKETMWDNNTDSAAKWSVNQINIGSYNGKYANPAAKYSGSGNGNQVLTIFDTYPAGMIRPARPSSGLRLMETNLDVIDTDKNGEYITGTSSVFYKLLSFAKGDNDSIYSSDMDSDYQEKGQSFESTYSPSHSKVNDIVIHDPVSVENSMVIPLDSSRDQRTALSQSIGGNLQADIIEYDKTLDPDWRPNLLFNGDAEAIDESSGTPVGWSANGSNSAVFTYRHGDQWVISDHHSFEINTPPNSGSTNYTGLYYQTVTASPNTNYTYSGTLSCHRCQGYAYVDIYNASMVKTNVYSTSVNATNAAQPFTLNFRTDADTKYIRVHIVKGNSANQVAGYLDYLFADDLSLVNNDSQTADKPIGFKPVLVENPDYVNPTSSLTQDYPYTGAVQSFTAPYSGVFTIQAWGAQGGAGEKYAGGKGGYSTGEVTLAKGQILYIYVGGQGQTTTSSDLSGGFNGGGGVSASTKASTSRGSGGGATHVAAASGLLSALSASPSSILLVAGGGGGSGTEEAGGNGGGAAGLRGDGTVGDSASGSYGGGGTQTAGGAYAATGSTSSNGTSGSFGQGGHSAGGGASYVSGGGGGSGYYGGGGGNSGSPSLSGGGGGGSSYTGGVSSGSTIDGGSSMPSTSGGTEIGHEGNGFLRITGRSSSTAEGESIRFTYTGAVQTFTAAKAGTYKIQAWGAQGGGISPAYPGGKGGYAEGTIDLAVGDVLNIYVGQNPSAKTGGWNGGGNGGSGGSDIDYGYAGGGASDVRQGGTALANRILVAGGGGGSDTAGLGGAGGGLASVNTVASSVAVATQTTGNALGQGANGPSYGGGGGGGYYGGFGGEGGAPNNGGSGGSGYIGGVSNGQTIDGTQSITSPDGTTETGHSGNGAVTITALNVTTASDPVAQFLTTWVEDPDYNPDIPDEAYILAERKTAASTPISIPGGGTYTTGNFINLDYGFTIYFPNKGDFFGDGALGIGRTTSVRGKGYIDGMDTTEWTQSKSVTFEFNVIYNGTTYTAGEEIDLPVECNSFNCKYQFYAPLGNREAISAPVTYKAIAINGESLDNDNPTNRVRYANLAARHSAIKHTNIDVVGRIGNMVIEDTGDFRFSNLFKNPAVPASWLIQGVVKKVNMDSQNRIIGDTVDIRGEPVSSTTNYLNTYGLTAHMQQSPIPFPLSPEKNNIAALQRQPMRIGYNVFADMQTIGNYYGGVQIIPYYYHLNLKTGTYTPVDVYMNVNSSYKPINVFDIVQPGWDTSSVYSFAYSLNWLDEAGRRNYSSAEKANTENVVDYWAQTDDSGSTDKMSIPYGSKFSYGTSQIMYLAERNRTFVGSSKTYGYDKNPGGVLAEELYELQAQRWHFTYGLPSSAIVVEHGLPVTQTNMNNLRTNSSVIVMAAEVTSIGDTYALKYSTKGINNPIQISGTSYSTASIPYPVIAVYSSSKSSADDLEVMGTH